MKKHLQVALWPALVVIAVVGVLSAFDLGPKYVGKSWFETSEFSWQLESLYSDVSINELNSIDPDEAAKKFIVTDQEIEDYRNHYGTLPEQLDNIERQYRTRINEAKENKNETLLMALVKERNGKLDDIKENFENTEHVKQKILKEKGRQLAAVLKQQSERVSSDFAVNYDFTDIETGEHFTKGDVSQPAAFKKEFNDVHGFFRAHSLTDASLDQYDQSVVENPIRLNHENLQQAENTVRHFKGTLTIPKSALAGGALQENVRVFNGEKKMLYVSWLVAALAIAALFTVVKFKKEWVTGTKESAAFRKWKFDVQIAGLFFAATVFLLYVQSAANTIPYGGLRYSPSYYTMNLIEFMLFGYLPAGLVAFQLVNLIEQMKQPGYLDRALKDTFAVSLARNIRDTFSNWKLGTQFLLLLVIFFLAGIGFVGMFLAPELIVVYAFCVLFVALPALFLFFRRGAYLNRLFAATEAMAAGQLTQEIPVKGKSPLAKHAANLNNLRDGVRVSVNEQAKSERLKTELITNVSHDLRTPLTSIITYTDLLKDETLSSEERTKYVEIIDQKSQRLKTLIEDLFEVSKMASGNLELVKQHADLNQLMQQALAEHAEDFSESDLDVRISLPEVPVYALVDGQKLWRVLDNLLINALKYSLPGTRVYVNLQKTGNQARITMKNIAKYEIGGNTDELFERFKRGDESRQTEGSGLGLAIAQSIIELHGGRMDVEVDGDLFKVTIDIAVG